MSDKAELEETGEALEKLSRNEKYGERDEERGDRKGERNKERDKGRPRLEELVTDIKCESDAKSGVFAAGGKVEKGKAERGREDKEAKRESAAG